MKKLLAAAVAATMSATAMADISIKGNAKFEYTNTDYSTGSTNNGTETEINLIVNGKSGDTQVVAEVEIDAAGGTENGGIDIEDTYIMTKLGPVNAKLGNYDTSTSKLLGEIQNGARKNDKMTFSYTTNGIQFYAGNSGTRGDDTTINNNMFAGVVATVEGWKLQAKKFNENINGFGVAGQAGPVGIRVEYSDGEADQDTGYFAHLTTKMDNIKLGFAMINMDADGGIYEDDSGLFAVSNGNKFKIGNWSRSSGNAGNSNTQLDASIAVDGTTYVAKVGKIGFDTAGNDDQNYYQVSAKRALASGTTLKTTYTSLDTAQNTDAQVFEVDLSVKF